MKNTSFIAKLKDGWSKADLMKYYAMDEKQYVKVLESLERIKSEVTK